MRLNKFLFNLFFISFIFISPQIYSQSLGFSLGYASSNSIMGDVFYQLNNNSFHVGYTYQFSDAIGKEVTSQKSNYGKTALGNDNYFSSIDISYGYKIIKKLRMNAEISIVTKKYFTNYSDKRFTGGGYHLINQTESKIGIGASISYILKKFEIFIGYNIIRKVGLGIRFIFFIKAV